MNPCDPILFHQLPVIRKIIADETWLEGERRGCQVASDDQVVRDRVCQIILRIGEQLRDSISASMVQKSSHPSSPVDGRSAAGSPTTNEAA